MTVEAPGFNPAKKAPPRSSLQARSLSRQGPRLAKNASTKGGFVSGHEFTRVVEPEKKLGFSPCAFLFLESRHHTLRKNLAAPTTWPEQAPSAVSACPERGVVKKPSRMGAVKAWLCVRARVYSCRKSPKRNWASAPALAPAGISSPPNSQAFLAAHENRKSREPMLLYQGTSLLVP
jgi:hypothetical protein